MPKLLIIDDEPNVCYSLEAGLEGSDWQVATALTGRDGVAAVATGQPDVVLLDVRLPDMSGLDVFDLIRAADPRLPVVVMTAFATTDTAIEAMKRGAFEYLLKPVDLNQLQGVLDQAADQRRMQAVPAILDADVGGDTDTDPVIGRSTAMQAVYKAIGRLAPLDVTVLLLGESGTGKELVARALFQHSKRADKPFLAINCAAIPEALLESELFGHEKGAFTGADRQRVGKFEQATGGTLFLDEVGDMSPATQAKVLRLLQDQRFERVGGNRTIRTDVRVIAATNRDLPAMVAAGTFRQDLLYRMNGFVVPLPPLRDRRDDIPLLADHFVRRYAPLHGKVVRAVSPSTLDLLTHHPWPGNVREFQNVIRFALVQMTGDSITPDCLPANVHGGMDAPVAVAAPDSDDPYSEVGLLVRTLLANGSDDIYRRVQEVFDQLVIRDVLRHVGGSQVQASELLGIARATLRAKLLPRERKSGAADRKLTSRGDGEGKN